MMADKFQILSIFLVIFINFCSSDRIRNKIYHEVGGLGTCFRLLNATQEIGCASGPDGNVGVVHYIKYPSDMDWLIQRGPHWPYVVLIHTKDFKVDLVDRLSYSGKVNGLVVLEGNQTDPEQFSPESTCPNDYMGLYKNHTAYQNCKAMTWNPDGTDMLYKRFDFPVFLVRNNTEIDFLIHNCYMKFNQPLTDKTPRDYPLCAAEIRDVMTAAVDTVTCHRRTQHLTNLNPEAFCQPLGDQNVYTTMKFVNKTVGRKSKSVIVAATKLDTSSLFENLYSGADSVITGVVALLAAADAIKLVKQDIEDSDKDIMFTFFQGETYGYIGSSRMVYDMVRMKFPQERKDDTEQASNITLTNILHFVEVNQLGLRDDGKLWIHSDPISQEEKSIKDEVKSMIHTMMSAAKDVNVSVAMASDKQPLPPASFQSFLKKRKISGIVLTDHQDKYTNKYYHSRFDVAKKIGAAYPAGMNESMKYDFATEQAKKLVKVSTMLAQTLYTLATGKKNANITADEKLVSHLLYCYLFNPRCELFRTVVDSNNAKKLETLRSSLPLYVSVDTNRQWSTRLTRSVLAYLLSDRVENATSDNCKQPKNNEAYSYLWMQGPVVEKEGKLTREPFCMKTLADLTVAVSPAFDIEDYDWLSGEYSTWTESVWPANPPAMSLRVFLLPSKQQQTVVLAVGVILFLLSMILVYFIDARASILFGKERTTAVAYMG